MIELFVDGPKMEPSAAATQTFGAIAAKGGGKSYLAGVAVEQLVGHGVPCIIIDPIGNWAWLKLHADGVQPGLGIAVLGGEHRDLDIDPDQGALIGQQLVELEASAVIDVSAWSKRQRKEFVADLCEALYRAARTRRAPRMVVFEEAQLFAPQRAMHGEERMLGAVTDIVRLGRNYGLGSMLITQRPQSVSKEVLNMIECLMVGGLRGPQERKTIQGWVTEQGIPDDPRNHPKDGGVMDQLELLPSLQPGEFFCWSPSWLKFFGRVHVGRKWTFDGSSTPTLNGSGGAPRVLPPVDIDALRARLDPAPKAKRSQDDEPELSTVYQDEAASDARWREQADALQESLDAACAERDESKTALRQELEMQATWVRTLEALSVSLAGLQSLVDELVERIKFGGYHANVDAPPPAGVEPSHKPRSKDGPEVARAQAPGRMLERKNRTPAGRPAPTSEGGSASAAGDDYVADLLAVIYAYGPVQRNKLSLLSGKSKKSSTFADAIRALIRDGLVVEEWDGLKATKQGAEMAPPIKLVKGRPVLDWWRQQGLDDYQRDTIDALVKHKRTGLTRQQIAEATGHSLKSSTFADALRRLQRIGICDVPRSGPVTFTADARDAMGL